MKRRSKIRLAAFAAALFSVMLIWAVTATVKAGRYSRAEAERPARADAAVRIFRQH